jgi:hypothetical protein
MLAVQGARSSGRPVGRCASPRRHRQRQAFRVEGKNPEKRSGVSTSPWCLRRARGRSPTAQHIAPKHTATFGERWATWLAGPLPRVGARGSAGHEAQRTDEVKRSGARPIWGPARNRFLVEVEETREENQLRTKRWSLRRSQGASEITNAEAVAHRQRSENDGRLGSPVPCPASERGAAPATERRELTRSKGPAQSQFGDRLDIASCVEVEETREENQLRTKRWSVRRSQGASEITDPEAVAHRRRSYG